MKTATAPSRRASRARSARAWCRSTPCAASGSPTRWRAPSTTTLRPAREMRRLPAILAVGLVLAAVGPARGQAVVPPPSWLGLTLEMPGARAQGALRHLGPTAPVRDRDRAARRGGRDRRLLAGRAHRRGAGGLRPEWGRARRDRGGGPQGTSRRATHVLDARPGSRGDDLGAVPRELRVRRRTYECNRLVRAREHRPGGRRATARGAGR